MSKLGSSHDHRSNASGLCRLVRTLTTIRPGGLKGPLVVNGRPWTEGIRVPTERPDNGKAGTREQYRERVAAKVAAAQEVLAAEVASLVTGDDWRK